MAAIEDECRGPPEPLLRRYFTKYYAIGGQDRSIQYTIKWICQCSNDYTIRTSKYNIMQVPTYPSNVMEII